MRWIYTFAHDGTGTLTFDIYGILVTATDTETGEETLIGTSLQVAETLEEAQNTVWEWVPVRLDFEPQPFTWVLIDDSIKLSWSVYDFERTIHIEIAEGGIKLIQQEPDISFIKE